jgi:hypothetical protein
MEGCPQALIHWTIFVSLTECRRCHMRVPCVISSGLILMIAVAGGFPLVVLVIPLARLGLPSCCSFLFVNSDMQVVATEAQLSEFSGRVCYERFLGITDGYVSSVKLW